MLHVLPQEICTLIFCGCQCSVEVLSCSLLCSCKPEVIWGPNTTICIYPWHFESLQYICGKICSCSYFHVHFVKRRFPLKCLFLFLMKVVDAAKRAEVGLQKQRCWLCRLLDSLLSRQQQMLMNKPMYTLFSCMHAYVWVPFTMLIRSVALWHNVQRLMHCEAVHRYCDFFCDF